jgi:hypothetical protein
MTRTQIQLPEPLFHQIKRIASARDWSVAELIRRGMEAYVKTIPETEIKQGWKMPVLRGSGGHLVDPATVHAESDALEKRHLISASFSDLS